MFGNLFMSTILDATILGMFFYIPATASKALKEKDALKMASIFLICFFLIDLVTIFSWGTKYGHPPSWKNEFYNLWSFIFERPFFVLYKFIPLALFDLLFVICNEDQELIEENKEIFKKILLEKGEKTKEQIAKIDFANFEVCKIYSSNKVLEEYGKRKKKPQKEVDPTPVLIAVVSMLLITFTVLCM